MGVGVERTGVGDDGSGDTSHHTRGQGDGHIGALGQVLGGLAHGGVDGVGGSTLIVHSTTPDPTTHQAPPTPHGNDDRVGTQAAGGGEVQVKSSNDNLWADSVNAKE